MKSMLSLSLYGALAVAIIIGSLLFADWAISLDPYWHTDHRIISVSPANEELTEEEKMQEAWLDGYLQAKCKYLDEKQ